MFEFLKKFLFKKEYAKVNTLINQAEKCKVYVPYLIKDITGGEFLFSMKDVADNANVVYWLNESRRVAQDNVLYSTPLNIERNIGRALAIDELIKGLEIIKKQYNDMITAKAAKDATIE